MGVLVPSVPPAPRIPKALAEEAHVGPGSRVDLTAKAGCLILRPLRPTKYRLGDLLSRVCEANIHKESGPIEVALPCGLKVAGVVLVDQIKSLDWRARKASYAGRAAEDIVGEVMAKALTLLEP